MLKLTIDRVDRLEGDFKNLRQFIKDAFIEMGKTINEGNNDTASKIDELFLEITDNKYDLSEIKKQKKTRDKFIKWGFDALKQALAITVSLLTIYLFLKYGGKAL